MLLTVDAVGNMEAFTLAFGNSYVKTSTDGHVRALLVGLADSRSPDYQTVLHKNDLQGLSESINQSKHCGDVVARYDA